MKTLIENFPQQINEALAIGARYAFKNRWKPVSNVVIAGLGGSGIGAEIVQNYVFRELDIPLFVVKDYFLPGFVHEKTLVIACSYSGNTEETLMAFKEAQDKQAQIVCICSGGQLADLAGQQGLDCILIPSDMPPRACLGYSLVQLLYVLWHFEIINNDFEQEIKTAAQFLESEASGIQIEAEELAKKLQGKLPVIYADQQISGIATRWRQQINENGKMLGWERILPEMNHNELVGWRDQQEHLAVVFLQNGSELDRIQKRIAINKKIIQPYANAIYDVVANGSSYWERAFYLILLGDWLSWYLAQLHGVDATEVKVIDYLKGELGK